MLLTLLLNMKIQHHSGEIDSEMMTLLLIADPVEPTTHS